MHESGRPSAGSPPAPHTHTPSFASRGCGCRCPSLHEQIVRVLPIDQRMHAVGGLASLEQLRITIASMSGSAEIIRCSPSAPPASRVAP